MQHNERENHRLAKHFFEHERTLADAQVGRASFSFSSIFSMCGLRAELLRKDVTLIKHDILEHLYSWVCKYSWSTHSSHKPGGFLAVGCCGSTLVFHRCNCPQTQKWYWDRVLQYLCLGVSWLSSQLSQARGTNRFHGHWTLWISQFAWWSYHSLDA